MTMILDRKVVVVVMMMTTTEVEASNSPGYC